MSTYQCSSCGREITSAPKCPHCHAEQPEWYEDLGRLERSIADMKAREAALGNEQRQIAAQMQAALFQRDILTHAGDERARQATRPRRVLRRRAGRRPPTAEGGVRSVTTPGVRPGTDPGPRPRVPRQNTVHAGGRDRPPPPFVANDESAFLGPDAPQPRPEASTREVQNILLGLGALLLGVAAVVFAAMALSSLDDFSRLGILVTATALMLAAPVAVARRGLTATAETIAAVGLLLVPLDGYALWTVDQVRDMGASGHVLASLTFLATALIAGGYARVTGLNVPRFAAVIAVQPILPLLAYNWISGPVGWAFVLAAVAAIDLYLVRLLHTERRPRRIPGDDQPDRVAGGDQPDRVTGGNRPDRATDDDRVGGFADDDRPEAARVPGGNRPGHADDDRPETAREEDDAVLITEPIGQAPRSGPPRAGVQADPGVSRWLIDLTGALHGLAVVLALGYAIAALLRAGTVPTAAQAGFALVLAAGVGLAGALALGRAALIDLAAGVLTLAVIGAVGRVAAVALPGRALLVIAAAIALAGLGVRALPEITRRGPQLAAAVALSVTGLVVAGGALRAALAPIRAALPAWDADLVFYADKLAAAVGPAGWQLATTAFLLTIAAVLALPSEIRHEFAVIGAALTALAIPASFGLAWSVAPWPPVLAAVGIGVLGLSARTDRAALTHAVAAALVGLAGAGAALARPGLTAAVLFTLAAAGILISLLPMIRNAPEQAGLIAAWAAGGAAFALPGAVAAFVAATMPAESTPTVTSLQDATAPVLAASFLAVCATLGFAALAQVSHRQISLPLALGTGFGALTVTAAAFGAPGATITDAWVGALLLVAAVLLFLAPSIDAGRRADRLLDGSDFAAAAATAGLVGTLARIATILAPGSELVAAALIVLVVAAGVRAMPVEWRRGPILGLSISGGVIALIAAYTALPDGIRALTAPGRLWEADLGNWPTGSPDATAWQVPLALLLLSAAAAIVLPRPWKYDIAVVGVGLATIGAPAALGLPWWSPIVLGIAVATGYGLAAVAAVDPRAGLARAAGAVAIALHAIGVSLVRPGTTAAALGTIALVGVVVAGVARSLAGPPDRIDDEEVPAHLAQIGGAATAGALLALPGAVAALAATLGWPAGTVVTSGLAGSSLGLAVLALVRRQVPQFLPYATFGIAVGATITAIASLPAGLPTGVYAAAAALLGVLAELIRSTTTPPAVTHRSSRRWSVLLDEAMRRMPRRSARGQWSVSPAAGALAAAVVPIALAVLAIAPTLVAALFDPYRTLSRIWQGPSPQLLDPPADAVDGTNVLAALLLTITAALAAVGLAGGRPARAVPVVLPGAAITLLIAPIALGFGWPSSTMAALAVFTIAMLGLALTPPPPPAERARSLRVARVLVFAIGLAAGGAGLAGALAARNLTLFTLGAAVGVGAVAALAGRTQSARILGWLFAAIMAQLFVLTAGLVAGLAPVWSAFGVLAVGAALLVAAATLPRLRHPAATREAATVEWSGYAAALIAGALAFDSPRHIAALLAAWGAVLGISATRPGRRVVERRILFWAAVGCEITAWWLLMTVSDVALPEAYTLPFAALALLVGVLELRHRADLSSWVAYGPALVAAFVPTLVIVLSTSTSTLRQVLLLLGAVATLIFGSMRRQQAPVVVGATVTAIAALHALATVGPWLVLIPVGVVLLVLGASNERRRRTQERLRGALRGMR
ncbi:hypothetical protein GCM10027280_56460 [Micromonospora polyrhachis]|uniref:Uncharacterized protein n=1 Tax=Micromonospora polyrhachis TaxID=1282883 RepID=A0A7W7WNA9_9ACTN|nr:permease [Micromonospora polyrhachis]MBB4958006.1 hypothetical protein [Micromonospora polyrhachis]